MNEILKKLSFFESDVLSKIKINNKICIKYLEFFVGNLEALSFKNVITTKCLTDFVQNHQDFLWANLSAFEQI